ncbi:MAG: aminomethyl-transferring glycine dehydrogenase subunit GcvPA [Lachnospiraceae bacterium]|nr:aminomethyl-transferring glycine dehydrogenase subunit GcvPA [Lachnospiraceae bacterium]MBQ9563377.1 aminomethyl-transferring glycine dehydrogenase subunit GcvPA [Lachnospiraceae bacterium]MBQ9593227.1 aminomethyl-transferring glycine dehydrogenase subunit GcvPA [Lachnospiraceae bacterium]
MANYLSLSEEDRKRMLEAIGIASERDLYRDVPEDLYLKEDPNLPSGKSEMEVLRQMKALAAKNHVFATCLRGAGAYRHYIPAIVSEVVGKETFLTAYTPYQAEISQGILQSIFEYQTMICELTGMTVANASVYDGATAAAEAAAMCKDRKRSKVLVSAAVHPDILTVMKTYTWAAGSDLVVVPAKDGKTDLAALRELADEKTAGVLIQQPNYYGLLEDAAEAGEIAHAAGAKYIMSVNPIAAAVLKTPADCGADIAVGEGQPLGMPLSWGGPYLGFMAAGKDMMRKLPGRIVGETTDHEGRKAYVLTLQAREQHIKREKASSNICSNEALCAMTAAVYCAAMGPRGIQNAANSSAAKAHYLAEKLEEIGYKRTYAGEFFHEFVTEAPKGAAAALEALKKADILGGLALDENHILWCATEAVTKEELDLAVNVLEEV